MEEKDDKKLNRNRNNAQIPISAKSRKTPFVKETNKKEKTAFSSIVKKNENQVDLPKLEKDIEVNEEIDLSKGKKENKKINTLISEQAQNAKKMREEEKDKKRKLNREKKEAKLKKQAKDDFIEKMDNIKKFTQDEKKVVYKRAIIPVICAILVTIYNILIVYGEKYLTEDIMLITLRTASIVFIIGTIIIFEIAYGKKNGKLGLIGVELLGISIMTLVSAYIYILYKNYFVILLTICTVVLEFYYLIKMVAIVIRLKTEHDRKISDVKEIVLEEEV